MAEWIKVLSPGEIEDGEMIAVDAGSLELCVGRINGSFFAVHNECSHEEYPLSDGEITEEGCIRCRYHGAKFDPFTGDAKGMPAVIGVESLHVEERPDGVYVFV